MGLFKVVMQYPDGTSEDEDELFETEAEFVKHFVSSDDDDRCDEADDESYELHEVWLLT